MTCMPWGIISFVQIQSIAVVVRRTHPWEAGYSGMLFEPCTATPPLKYLGRYNSPS